MKAPRISYRDPASITDPAMLAELDRCRREGTPRPESQAVRAHVPAVFWSFANSWRDTFKNGVADHAIKELYDETVNALGMTGLGPVEVRPRNPDDVFSILLDPSKTHADFGWQTSTSLDTGVARTIEWYRRFGVSQTFTHLKPVETKS